MNGLLGEFTLKNLKVRNRIVRSATYDGLADKTGRVTPRQIKLFTDLAEGKVGLIISGIVGVQSLGNISLFMNSLFRDELLEGQKQLVRAVHERGGKIAAQLFHGGREAAVLQDFFGQKAVAPSVVPGDPYCDLSYREITEDEIQQTIEAFGIAAENAQKAGYDAVQVHGAHAYLFSQFLSPYTNHRTDSWGGTLENRLRLHREVYKSIRAKVGQDYPVMIKLGVEDGFKEGLRFNEGKQAALALAEVGYDALEISSGLRGTGYAEAEFRTKIKTIADEGYFRQFCKQITESVNIPTIMVGGLRSLGLLNTIIDNHEADFVALSRPLIREPDLIKRWSNGDTSRATCISCNGCYQAIKKGPVHCAVKKKERDKQAAKTS